MDTKEQPYEIFISFKHSEADGSLTADYRIARELYEYLTEKGLRTFFSNETFKDLGTSVYKQKIDEILDTAKVLIVVGTSREHLESNWVRYEWDSFSADILDGIKTNGKMFSYLDRMSPSELPRTLRRCQAFERKDTSLEQVYRYICSALGKTPVGTREPDKPGTKYTILDYAGVKQRGWDFGETVQKLMDIVYSTLDMESDSSILNTEASVQIMERSVDTWRILLGPDGQIIGHWLFISLYDEEFEKLMRGELKEEDINYRNINYLDLPGYYKGYFAQIDIVKEYRNARSLQLLIISFLQQLEALAAEGIFITDWCVEALSPEGASLSRSMGLSRIGVGREGGYLYAGKADLMFKTPIFKRVPNLIKLYKEEWEHNRGRE